MELTPKRITIAKALKLIAMDFDDMVIDDDVIEHWEEMLSDIPDALILAAVKVVKIRSQFRPKVADIRKAALALINPESEIDAGQAWGLVLKAIRCYGYSLKALASLPPTVASAARRVGWMDLCNGEEMVSRAHFLKVFEGMQDREKQIGVLPPALQSHFREAALEAALEAAPVSMAQIRTSPDKLALPDHPATAPGRVSGYTPPQNVVAFRKRPQARSAEELRQQADLLTQGVTTSRETADFKAMTEAERAEYLKQQTEL